MTYTPHDALFKAVFSRPERAAEVLQGVLPPAVVREIELGSLTLEPGSFIDEDLREQFTDLLFHELFVSSAAETLLVYTPRFSFTVDDLTGQDEDALRRRAVSAHTRLTLMSLRSMRRVDDLRRWLEALRGLFEELLQEPDGEHAFALLLRYDFEVRRDDDHPTLGTFAAELSQERNMQTIAQMLENRGLQLGLERGRQEGLQEGLQAVLTRQLRRRFGELPPAALARIAAADSSQLERWADRVLDAASLDEVLR